MTIRLLNGSQVYATLVNCCWIEEERSWFGRDQETGEHYYCWDLEESFEGTFATSFRRAT